MNKLLFGATMGMMAGVALMMSPMGKMVRKEMRMGMNKAKQMAKSMENMEGGQPLVWNGCNLPPIAGG